MTDNIIDQTPQGTSFPPVAKATAQGVTTNPPRSPLQGQFARQWQWALWAARQKNKAAQSNPVTGADGDTINARVPLA
jgi:hypothetical protein